MVLAEAHNPFGFMGLPHVAAMALIALAAVGLCLLARKSRRPLVARIIAWAVAALLLASELGYWAWSLPQVGGWEFLRRHLPLHICGAGVFLGAAALILRRQFVYEIVYFWALGGTVQAIVTPDLTIGYPAYRFFQYFLTHGLVVAAAVFATWGLGMRPRAHSVWKVFAFSLAFTAAVGGANWLLDANYMFLCEAAGGQSPFFFLPWPWYIAFQVVLGLGIMWLLYLPFWVWDRLRAPQERRLTRA